MKKIILLAAAVIVTITLRAQTPQKMSYQAVIRNTTGQLINNTTVGTRISIRQGSASGTVAFSETHSVSTNANGLISLEIGTGTPVTALFSDIDWANGPYFIQTETDPAGGTNYTIEGVSELMSVPYALFAANGTPGPQGPQGLQGATGPQGIQGDMGPQGIQGDMGPQGIQGDMGPQGIQGDMGPQGIQGATGPMGPMGPMGMGMPGMPGATGPQGIQGETGPQGIQGEAGPQGIQGATGPMGPMGPMGMGMPGMPGATGPQGIQGEAGPQGIQGATGAVGPQGPQGPSGATGATGLTGTAGLTGSGYGGTSNSPKTLGTGPGKSYNTQAGMAYIAGDRIRLVDQTTITNYVEGTIVSYVGTTVVANIDVAVGALGAAVNNWNISLAGIPGATGATGAVGPQGPQGPAGMLSSGTATGNTTYWNGTAWVLNSNTIYNNGTNVGIGTNVPAAKLDVNGNAKVAGSLDVSTTTGALILPRMTTAQRNLLTVVAGMMIFNTDVTKFQGYAYSPPTTITDQSQMTGSSGTGLAFAGQSFTAGATGIFQSLSVSVYMVMTPGSYTLNIHNGAGTGGAVLSTQTVTVNSTGMPNFVLATPVNVTAGNQYTFNFIAIGGADAGAIVSNGNPYSGGYLLNMGAGGGWDAQFQTFVTIPATGGWVNLH